MGEEQEGRRQRSGSQPRRGTVVLGPLTGECGPPGKGRKTILVGAVASMKEVEKKLKDLRNGKSRPQKPGQGVKEARFNQDRERKGLQGFTASEGRPSMWTAGLGNRAGHVSRQREGVSQRPPRKGEITEAPGSLRSRRRWKPVHWRGNSLH